MTEKAQKILNKIRKRKLPIPVVTERILDDFNRSTLDDVGPVAGGDRELKVLKEMNELEEFQNENYSHGAV